MRGLIVCLILTRWSNGESGHFGSDKLESKNLEELYSLFENEIFPGFEKDVSQFEEGRNFKENLGNFKKTDIISFVKKRNDAEVNKAYELAETLRKQVQCRLDILMKINSEDCLEEDIGDFVLEVNYEHKINTFPSCCGLNGELWKSNDDELMSIQNADGTVVEIYEDGEDNRNSELTSKCQNIIGKDLQPPLDGIGFSSTDCMCDVYARSYGRFEEKLPTWNAKILKTARNNYKNYKVHLMSHSTIS